MSKQKEIKIRRKKYREPLKKCIKALEIAAANDIVDHDYGRYQGANYVANMETYELLHLYK